MMKTDFVNSAGNRLFRMKVPPNVTGWRFTVGDEIWSFIRMDAVEGTVFVLDNVCENTRIINQESGAR